MIELRTKRLFLRKVRMEDAEILYREQGCNPEITRYTGWNPYYTLDAAKEKIAEDLSSCDEKGFYSWIITSAGKEVGTVGAYGYEPEISSIEIGYTVFQHAWGNGYASEAVAEVVRYLFEDEKFNRIHAWCHGENQVSAKVLEKAGLKEEGRLRQGIKNPDGSLGDQRLYGIIYSQWKCCNKSDLRIFI